MQGNRSANTKPEVQLRSALHRLGLRFRKDLSLQVDGVRVRPDIVFTRAKVAVFVDGCFWHRCPEHGNDPFTNSWYWRPKLERNVARDRQADAALAASDWAYVRVWTHEDVEVAANQVRAVVERGPGGQPERGRGVPREGQR